VGFDAHPRIHREADNVLGNAVHFGVAETYPREVVATILKSAL
jgi:hypothetical protein